MPTTPAPIVDVEAILPGRSKEAIRLHPRRSSNLSPSISKVGGLILWPNNEPWPRCAAHETDFVTVLQLLQEDVPVIGFPPRCDLLQVLWCPNVHPERGYWPDVRIAWRNSRDLGESVSLKPSVTTANTDYLVKECRVTPERVIEYPDGNSLTDEQWDSLDKWYSENRPEADQDSDLLDYWSSLSVASGFKVGGYPRWTQMPDIPQCDCGALTKYMLTIDSAEFDGGTYKRWLPLEERHVWTADFETRMAVQCAPGIMLGDMGEMNLFVCKNCTPWKLHYRVQCC
jgi:hypothetical protein